MIELNILGSSSAGNCTYLKTPSSQILIDVGFSGRRVEELLQSCGGLIEDINAVFITHEHADHTAGLVGLAKYEHLEYYATAHTAEALQGKLKRQLDWKTFEAGSILKHKDWTIETFSIPHDAYDPVAYLFHYQPTPNTEKLLSFGIVTDLGYMPQGIMERLKAVDYLILESNYDTELLDQDDKRPWSLKQRIKGRHGHLSNETAIEVLKNLHNSRLKQVWLGHLSRDCNDVEQLRNRLALEVGHLSFTVDVIDPLTTPFAKITLSPELEAIPIACNS